MVRAYRAAFTIGRWGPPGTYDEVARTGLGSSASESSPARHASLPQGGALTEALYNHPLVYGLFRGRYHRPGGKLPTGGTLPSYIPSRSFALALLDIVAQAGRPPFTAGGTAPTDGLTIDAVREGLAHIQNPTVRRVLEVSLGGAQGSLQSVQAQIETWFDSGMDRVSGWYKRHTQLILIVLAVVVVIGTNANTITLVSALSRSPSARAVVVAAAENEVAAGEYQERDLQTSLEALTVVDLPLGWRGSWRASLRGVGQPLRDPGQPASPGPEIEPGIAKAGTELDSGTGAPRAEYIEPVDPWLDIISPIFGWSITVLCVSLGAPFWFEVLNRLMVVRSTVKPRRASHEDVVGENNAPHAGGVGLVAAANRPPTESALGEPG